MESEESGVPVARARNAEIIAIEDFIWLSVSRSELGSIYVREEIWGPLSMSIKFVSFAI